MKLAIYIILTALSIVTIISYFKKNKILLLIGFLLLSMNYGAVFFHLLTENQLTVGILDSILETNYKEASSVITEYKSIVIFALASSFLSFYLSIKIKKEIDMKLIKAFFWLIFLYLSLLVGYFFYGKNNYRELEDFKETPAALGIYLYNKTPHPLSDLIYIITKSLEDKDRYSKKEEEKKTNPNIVRFKDAKSDTIIFVMGESSWKRRYSIYGYNVNTTPNMINLFKNNESGCVLDGYAPATITRDSIPISFSFAKPNNYKPLTNEKSIIELAKIQGYKTYWISSQDINGLYSSKYGYLTKSINDIKFTNFNDRKIANLLNEALKDNDEKKFIIIHLLGSHLPYNNFTPEDKKELINADNYDLTIHQTDKVISDIFNTLKEDKYSFSFIYTSDHGEVVNIGHGLLKGKSQIEIPLVAYSNNNYDICNYYKKNTNGDGKINALVNKIVLLNMMGIDLKNDFIKDEISNGDILKSDGTIVNYRDFK
ncbi:phosphoethanolamine transferase [Xenorhabdus stockiae]|uniref:phosphoethanolamine transferase n=1 Tax=Xenorhabdus stockiae TaxID=351614 RepID=UPI003CECB327